MGSYSFRADVTAAAVSLTSDEVGSGFETFRRCWPDGESLENRSGSYVQRSSGPSRSKSHWRQCTKLGMWISLWRIHQQRHMFGGFNWQRLKMSHCQKTTTTKTVIRIMQRSCMLGIHGVVWNLSCNTQVFKIIRKTLGYFLCCDCTLRCGAG